MSKSPLHGPGFSSYPAEEVGWLLTDLTEAALPTADGHLGEMLAEESPPTPEYVGETVGLMLREAERVAYLAGVTAEQVLDRRGPDVVLVSTVRAGVPVGILLRRWLDFAHGITVNHHAIGLKRGIGLDPVALRWLGRRYAPARIQFVDAWTGKGGVAKEVVSSISAPDVPGGFDPTLAVLTDPGRCTDLYGTRNDVLVPSACLNSMASGLVSSPVVQHQRIGPDDFYGARFLREFADLDVSCRFIDAVADAFPAVASTVAADWPEIAGSDRTPDWTGWRTTEEIARRYSIDHRNLRVRPGIGETMRVLLSGLPGRVIVNPEAVPGLEHVLGLARQRGLPIDEIPGLPYACVGLIDTPAAWTRGETGARL